MSWMKQIGNMEGMIMKTRNILYLSLAFLAMSCAKEITPETEVSADVKYVDVEFTAGIETKTTLADGNKVIWTAGDKVSVFDNSATAETHNNEFAAAASEATSVIYGSVPADATEFYALYPYRQVATIAGTVISNCYLNPIQAAKAGSFNNNQAPMIGKADAQNNFTFKNLVSHIKVNVPEDMTDVKSITLMGNNNEAITGVFSADWNGGEPVVTITSPETYATVRVNNGAMAPGDYYITVLPVEFKNGFTVIYGKTDGTQVAKKTSNAITAVNKRNQILPMKPLASTDLAEHMNYWVKYNDGFDITVSGYTFNKTTHTGGKLVNDTKGNATMASDGVYFVMPQTTTACFGGHKSYSKYIVMGADASVRTPMSIDGNQGLKDAGTVFMLANLSLTYTGSWAVLRSHNPSFGDIVLNNCSFAKIPKTFLDFENGAPDVEFALNSVTIEDCELGFNAAAAYVFSKRKVNSTVDKFEMTNNIIYACDGITMTDFKIISGYNSSSKTGPTVKDYKILRNTFHGTVGNGTLSAVSGITGESVTNNNLLVIEFTKATEFFSIYQPGDVLVIPASGESINNYYYTSTTYKLNVPSKYTTNLTRAGSPVLLASSPLAATWDPANGVFGDYTITPVDESKIPGENVIIGARR